MGFRHHRSAALLFCGIGVRLAAPARAVLDLPTSGRRARSSPQEDSRSERSLRWDARKNDLFGATFAGALDARFADVQNALDDPTREDRNEYYLGFSLATPL